MSRSSAMHGITSTNKKLKGVRRRKWGKWVSEIRVPGTQERLWLGTYATQEAAAIAHDVAVYCLRRPSSLDKLNFPQTLSLYNVQLRDMSPRSVQKVASDIGMDVDSRNIVAGKTSTVVAETNYESDEKKIDERSRTVCNVDGGGADDHSDVFWWDAIGNEDGGSWHGSGGDSKERDQALSISIEDYL